MVFSKNKGNLIFKQMNDLALTVHMYRSN